MSDTDWIAPGRRVCVEGKGTAATLHRHPLIVRVTKTQIVCDDGNKYRLDEPHNSIPYSTYGGSYLHRTCQRPKTAD